jgi:MarR family transcriptional regulator for hemolysin
MNDRAEFPADEVEALRHRLGFLMRDSARLMRRRFIQLAREVGLPLNQSEATTLVQIAHEPGLHQVTLAGRLDIEPIMLVRLLDSLQEAGLIERRNHETDRRVRTIWPTEAAYPMLEAIDAIRVVVRGEAMRGLSAVETERFLDTLVTVRGNLTGLED